MEEKKNKRCWSIFNPTKRRKLFLNAVNLAVFGSLVFLILFTSGIVEASEIHIQERNVVVEESWRQQLRTSLVDIKEQFLIDIENETINTDSNTSVQMWADVHLSGRKIGGPSGDPFVVALPSGQIIWDNSTDVPRTGTELRFLGDGLSFHRDQAAAIRVYSEMRKIYSTDFNSKMTWNFDGSDEFLEWIIVPADRFGFNSEPKFIDGKPNPKYKVFLMGYGIQSDELFKPFQELDDKCQQELNKLIFLNYFLTIGGILFIFWFFYLEYSHD